MKKFSNLDTGLLVASGIFVAGVMTDVACDTMRTFSAVARESRRKSENLMRKKGLPAKCRIEEVRSTGWDPSYSRIQHILETGDFEPRSGEREVDLICGMKYVSCNDTAPGKVLFCAVIGDVK